MSEFAAATTVVRRSGGTESAEFDADLDPHWSARDVLQGGYLVAVLGRTGAEVVGAGVAGTDVTGAARPHLTSASAVFLDAPQPGPARVRIDVLRAGRSTTHLRGQLLQEARLAVEAHLIQGRLDDRDAWWSGRWSGDDELDPPDSGDCVPIPAEPPGVGFGYR